MQPDTYATVAAAIRFIRERAGAQPSLEDVAAHVGMSPHHLQRVFSDWAGLSPKRFLQYLTKEYAKRLLSESHDVLSASLAAGLSSPSRLHDLLVVCDAVTPGEVRAAGAGLAIQYGFADTPLGRIILATTERGICHLHFIDDTDGTNAIERLKAEWPLATLTRSDALAAEIAQPIFGLSQAAQPLRVLLRGTNFQVKVWEALIGVPAGRVVSYTHLASMADAPRAQRAVGTALAQNSIAFLIPCHRVIRESGEINHYRWGAERKQALIAWEQARYGQTP